MHCIGLRMVLFCTTLYVAYKLSHDQNKYHLCSFSDFPQILRASCDTTTQIRDGRPIYDVPRGMQG